MPVVACYGSRSPIRHLRERRQSFAIASIFLASALVLSSLASEGRSQPTFQSPSSSFETVSRRRSLELLPVALASSTAGPALAEELRKVRKNFVESPSGLQYRVLKEGEKDGELPGPGRLIRVDYTGWLYDFKSNKVFDTTRNPGADRGSDFKLFQFRLGEGTVIKAWEETFSQMKVGERRLLIVPPKLGYGDVEMGGGEIPADSTLYFDVELRKLVPNITSYVPRT